ncbi:MAG: hypothetical protein M1838_002189 [Thelocarpon superellum]|nr:MAG: hypothetical protein M1838_002189 [Thelocarpon superellum]
MESLVSRDALVGVVPPPPGVTADLEHPAFNGGRLIIINAVFMPIAVVCVAIRIFTRFHIIRAIGWDDYALLLALFFSIVETAVYIIHTQNGLGYHLWETTYETLSPRFLLGLLVSSIFYTIAICFLKLSMLLLYLQFSPAKWYRYVVRGMIFVIVGFAVASVVAMLASCTPLDKVWDLEVTWGHCTDRAKQSLASGSMNIITDVLLIILPLPVVWRLRLPLKQKLALVGVFMIGTFVFAVSVTRLIETLPLVEPGDYTWDTVTTCIWCTLELYVGIICASVITYRPFLTRYMPVLWGRPRKQERDTGETPKYHQWPNSLRVGGFLDLESRELSGGPKNEVIVTARQPNERCSEDTFPRSESIEEMIRSPHSFGIIKTTHVRIKSAARTSYIAARRNDREG